MDHEDLLRKYLEHVGQSEGTDFLGPVWTSPTSVSDVTFSDEELAELRRLAGWPAPTPAPDFVFGTVAEATYNGERIAVRYGTSPLGREWEVVSGDYLGHLPTSDLEDLVVMEDRTR